MAERSQAVLDRVAQALREQPGSRSRDLYDLAKEMDPTVGDLTVRQFHASYVLPARRTAGTAQGQSVARARGGKKTRQARATKGAAAKEPRPGAQAPTGDREAIRIVLLRFAADISGAETRSEIVGVLASLDRYVDEILRVRR